jgi:hypothetical protein
MNMTRKHFSGSRFIFVPAAAAMIVVCSERRGMAWEMKATVCGMD